MQELDVGGEIAATLSFGEYRMVAASANPGVAVVVAVGDGGGDGGGGGVVAFRAVLAVALGEGFAFVEAGTSGLTTESKTTEDVAPPSFRSLPQQRRSLPIPLAREAYECLFHLCHPYSLLHYLSIFPMALENLEYHIQTYALSLRSSA